MTNPVDFCRIVPRNCGGWLGLADGAGGLKIGVVGHTEEQTRTLLTHAVERWQTLLQPPLSQKAAIPNDK